MVKNNKKTEPDEVKDILVNIERLLVLLLIKKEVTQKEIGKALGINQSTVSRRFPGTKTKSKPKKKNKK